MQVFAQGSLCPGTNETRPRPYLQKMVRSMKLIAVLLTLALTHAHARGFSQTVTYSGKDVSLETVFAVIKKQTGYTFLYYKEQLQQAKKVTVDVKNATVDNVLTICLRDQPFDYSIEGKTIFIVGKQKVAAQGATPIPADPIRGRIINSRGEPLAEASVVVKRTGKGTITDANGFFKLADVSGDDMITLSYTGYQPQSVRVGTKTNMTYTLALADNELDEMVIQAYGKTTRRLATGNIVKVSAAEIEKQPVMNPLLALQGRVAGLEVSQINGYASAPVKVELRGRSAISGAFTPDPLYIIDGVPLTVLDVIGSSSLYSSGSNGFTQSGIGNPAGGQSPLFSINPNDIESIEVLKDADATAIYGSRGANGVILISTKKGKAGKAKLDMHIQEGITRVSRFWDMMNTSQYVAMRKEALRNDNLDIRQPINAGDAYDLTVWDTTRYTNWQKEIYGGIGKNLNVQGGLSGGSAQTNFRMGVGYNKTTSITTVDGFDSKATASFNLTHHSTNQKLTVLLSTGFTYSQSNMISLPGNVTSAPNAPAVYDSVGNLNWVGWGGALNNTSARSALSGFSNLKQPYSSKTNFLSSNLTINYQIIRGLNINTSFGYNNANANQEYLFPISSYDPASKPTGSSQYGYSFNKNWIVEPKITYNIPVWDGKLEVLVGSTLQKSNTDGSYVIGSGYTSDLLLKSISSAPSVRSYDAHGVYKYAAVFGRLNYNILGKYIINVSARRDGSSRFGKDKQYGNFGSAGVAWIFTQEGFMKNILPFLGFGKIRGSYGLTGSDGVGDYQYLTRWNSINVKPYMGITPLLAIQHANPDFHWSTNRKLEVALELAFLRERIALSAAYYRNRCGDQLLNIPIGTFTGFSTVTANSRALVQNDGWEFTASFKIISNRSFSWSVNMNTSINRNKLVSYPNFNLSPYVGSLIVGKPLNISKLYHFVGVNPLTGQYAFEDKNHDGKITHTYDGLPDDTYAVNLSPKFFGGIGSLFSYKSFQLSVFFNFKKQVGINTSFYPQYPGNVNNNMPANMANHWQKPGDVATIARFSTQAVTTDYNFQFSDGAYTDASFLRLSNVAFSYGVPSFYTKKVGLQACSLFLNINNLLVVTRYKGIDPETQNFGGMPPIKVIVGGVNFSF